MKRLWPKSLAGQLVLLLVSALCLAQLVVLVLSAGDRLRIVAGLQTSQTIAVTRTLIRLLEGGEPSAWPNIVRAFDDRNLDAELSRLPAIPDTPGNRRGRLQGWIERRLPKGFGPVLVDFDDTRFFDSEHWRRDDDDDDEHEGHRFHSERVRLTVAIGLPGDEWLNLKQHLRPPPIWAGITWGYFALSALLISLVTVFAVRRLTRPLRALAGAAESFGTGGEVPKLAVEGPIELQKAASAFNHMADRVSRFVRDRTAMLAAISHDLRTPITSLRLRAEFVEDEETREKMLETLDEMAAMTRSTLDFARQDAQSEPIQPLDLTALLESLSDDLSEQGKEAAIAEMPRQIVIARPTALKRALRNLIENAVRYGERARISSTAKEKTIEVHIDDDGPGIPVDQLERVFEPFTRLEASRNRETGGTGLGLAIARTIIHAHGGEITLKNRKSGLRASVTLPLSSSR